MSLARDVPESRARAITRPRLIETMGVGDERAALIIVHGPTGTGKSALLSQWARSLDLRDETLLWITLNPDDAGILPFWARIGSALTHNGLIVPDSPLVALEHLETVGARLPELLADGFRSLGAMTLVLDDYHNIGSEAVDRQLGMLLDRVATLRLAVGTRTWTGLHSIELAARLRTTLLDADALAFTPAESRRLVAESALGRDDAVAEAIQAAAGGWALACQALLVEAERDPESRLASTVITRRSEFVGEFIRAAIAARDERSRDVLLRIALADECTAELAVELAEAPAEAVERELARLESEGIGTWQLRAGERWFRLHPLLQQELEKEATRALGLATTSRLRGTLSDRLIADRPLRALELAFAAGDWERFEAVLLLRYGLLAYYHRQTAMDLLYRVPQPVLVRRPDLLATRLASLYGKPRIPPDELRREFAAFADESGMTMATRPPLVDAIGTGGRMVAHRLFGDMTHALSFADLADEAFARSPDEERRIHSSAIPFLSVQIAITHLEDEQYLRSLDELERTRNIADESATAGDRFQALAIGAMANALRGDMLSAGTWIERCEAAEPYDGWSGAYLAAGYHVAKALAAVNRWDAETAAQQLETLSPWQPVIEYWPYMALASAYSDLLQLGPAEAHARLAETLHRKRRRPPPPKKMRALLAAASADLLMLSGQPVRADSLIRRSRLAGHPDIDLVGARLAAARGDREAGMRLADRVAWHSVESPRRRAEALLTSAVLAFESDRPERALEAFGDATTVLRANGLRLPLLLVASGERLRELTAFAAEHGADGAGDLLDGLPAVGSRRRPLTPLTKAERRVLRSLAETGDVERSAAQLHLSPYTVRYHLKRSYQRLGVSRREDAITVAQELGMLDD